MSRIPTASRESVPQDQVAAFDEMVSQRGSIPDIGPISVMINVPELAKRGENFRAYIRGEESSLSANVRELAMILTAREMDCQFIWNAHCAFGRQSGLSDELVDSLDSSPRTQDWELSKTYLLRLLQFGVRDYTHHTVLAPRGCCIMWCPPPFCDDRSVKIDRRS